MAGKMIDNRPDAEPARNGFLHVMRTRAIALIAVICLGVGIGACGDSKDPTHTTASRFLGDGDYDVGDGDWDNNWDTDEDAPFDYYSRKSYSWNHGVSSRP